MSEDNLLRQHVKDAIFAVLDETFVSVQGFFLDRGTSLLETLATATATDVSVPVSESGASIAGHVEHVRFYLLVLMRALRGQEIGKVDWQQSWLVQTVTSEEWDTLRSALRGSYQEVRDVLMGFDSWEGEEDISGALCVIAHTAYHLGAIRLALYQLAGGRSPQ